MGILYSVCACALKKNGNNVYTIEKFLLLGWNFHNHNSVIFFIILLKKNRFDTHIPQSDNRASR